MYTAAWSLNFKALAKTYKFVVNRHGYNTDETVGELLVSHRMPQRASTFVQ